jgi:AGCS family alanine or glycine:cation symporter
MDFLISLDHAIVGLKQMLWGWPLLGTFLVVGVFSTIRLYFVQIKYFFTSWKMVFLPSKDEASKGKAALSPFQAFLNALSTALGNGSIAGMGAAIFTGGPGAIFWLWIAGALGMALRYAEVFLATYFIGKKEFKTAKGGPMVYLSLMPGGNFLPYVFALFMLLYGLTSGNAMQANAIGRGLSSVLGVSPVYIAFGLLAFVVYVLAGGAQRVINVSDKLAPFKVIVFVVATSLLLVYHWAGIVPAIVLICKSAFSCSALAGGATGVTIQKMIQSGTSRSLNAHEAGLGVAAVFFGASGSSRPVQDSILSMLTVFISNFVVCTGIALAIIASGVWNSGADSVYLTIAAFSTFYGSLGGWIVTFLAASFGLGVLVAFAFVTAELWSFLTGGRWKLFLSIVYALVAFFGTMATVSIIWNINDLVNGTMLLINLYAIVYFMPLISRELKAYMKSSLNK